MATVTLYRPVGEAELVLIRQADMQAFPPRLPEQPIFYPVLNEEYASEIARNWNAKRNNPPVGYVTRFQVNAAYVSRYPVQTVGRSYQQEYWVPAEELPDFNAQIVGEIEVIAEYHGDKAEAPVK